MEKCPKRILALILRVLALGATLSASIIMATSSERANFFKVSFEAEYSDTPAFKYFVIVNAVVSVCALLVLLPSENMLWRLAVALDMIVTVTLTSSISAALAIAQVGKRGNSSAGGSRSAA